MKDVIKKIDAIRRDKRMKKFELCLEAKMHPEKYRRLLNGQKASFDDVSVLASVVGYELRLCVK